MSFASIIFFLFLPTVFCVYWLVPKRFWQNLVLLAASYIFYSWWDWRFCLLMLGSSLIDYWAGLKIDNESSQSVRKRTLTLALGSNLLILGVFKYFNFFADSLKQALAITGLAFPEYTWTIVLPVGISFYTFQTMSYTLDIYFRRFRSAHSVVEYLSFVSFFPQLVAGPIERATALLPQFQGVRTFSLDSAREGCRFILWGLAKKMLVADNLAPIVNNAFSSPQYSTAAVLFFGTVCFAFQIYCDFSAYSDIAVGSARLFGIQLMRNFDYPYFSQSITEFWRRWHISLSSWFRDYLYIPLGGNRVSKAIHHRNLLLVAVISGLWHGAAWHFVVWGALHGIFLVTESFLGIRPKAGSAGLSEDQSGLFSADFKILLRTVRTFALVCIAWIFFRAASLSDAMTIVLNIGTGLVHADFYADLLFVLYTWKTQVIPLAALLLIEWFNRNSWNTLAVGHKPIFVRWGIYTILCWCILLFGTRVTETFIYFQF